MKFNFLRPQSFRERWQTLMIALVGGAGMVATALAIGLVWIIWKGGWSLAVEALRVAALANGLLAMCVLMGLAMGGLLIAGPLHRVRGKALGAELSAEGDRE